MNQRRFLSFLAGLGLCITAGSSLAVDEVTVKVAYLYNFAKFIKWPDENRSTLRLCDLGNDSLGNSLDTLIGKPVRNMHIRVRRAVTLQDIPQCDLIFVPAGHVQTLERVSQMVNGYPILVVTESANALPKGAMVALIQSDDRISFEIDLNLARALGLEVSGKLLQLARKVY